MNNNGIIAVYEFEDGDDGFEKDVKDYLEELSNFNNDIGKELLSNLRDKNPDVYKNYTESQQKKFRNWQNGRNIPYRKNLIELCFDYQITELDEINSLLYAFNYEALHLRDKSDLSYYFALKNGIPYKEASEKSKEYKEKFEKEYGKESGESKRTSTGLYTRMVLEEVASVNTWQDLEDYIEENKAKLGKIKITAYKKAKQFINELESKDKENVFYNVNDIEYRKLLKAVRKSMGLPEENEKIHFFSILNRTESISRGVFILYNMKTIFEKTEKNRREIEAENFVEALNTELDMCTFAQLNSKRCLWDKIVCDCIEAALDIGLYYDDNNATPYELAIMFLEYIQDAEK